MHTCFRLMKGRATFFLPETIVASYLHLMVLFFKMLLNHSIKLTFFQSIFFLVKWNCGNCINYDLPMLVRIECIYIVNESTLRLHFDYGISDSLYNYLHKCVIYIYVSAIWSLCVQALL